MEIPLLDDIVVIFGLAIVVTYICHRLHIPVIVGFLITGAIAGPYGLSFVGAVHEVEVMAEIGVILLLFSIGLEFSVKHLLQIRRAVLLGGTWQVLFTFLIALGIALFFELPLNKAIFIGFLAALSSTAIVLSQLQSSRQMDSPHGRTTLGILIFQDVIIVPMMIVTPFLADAGNFNWQSGGILILKIFLLMALIYVSSKWIIPRVFYQIARTRNREIFLLSIVFIAFGIAWVTSTIGLSLALGAFIAGLIIAESEYSHNAISHILPFRDIFLSFFFVSIGMLLNPATLLNAYPYVLGFLSLVIVVKFFTAGGAALLLGYPLRTALLVGLSLAQIGEFSFILAKSGYTFDLLSPEAYQLFLAVTVLAMLLTPFIMQLGRYAEKLTGLLPLPGLKKSADSGEDKPPQRRDHLIIIGFGLNGRNLAHAAKVAHIPYVIVDLNPETVRKEKGNGEPIYFGDAGSPAVLTELGVEQAQVLVVAVPDIVATRRIVFLAKLANPDIHIVCRTRFTSEIEALRELGADEIIAEEFESAIEIFSRVLNRYDIPAEQVSALTNEVRSEHYQDMVTDQWACADISELDVPAVQLKRVKITETSPLAGKTLQTMQIKENYNILLLALIRNDRARSQFPMTEKLAAGDELVLLGNQENLNRFVEDYHLAVM